MKLVITGGSGQLARRAAELLLAKIAPQDLIVTTRTPAELRSFAERGVLVRQADFATPQTLSAAFAGAERMLLVSATELSRRTAQHRAAIDAAQAAGVRHVVYTSGLRPEPPNPAVVAPSHHETEQALAQSGMAWTILRMSLYADYQIPEASEAIAAGVLVHNRGDGTVAYVARDDCAAVAAAVLIGADHAGKRYDVTGPRAYSAADLAALYGKIGGRPVVERRVGDAELVAGIVGTAEGDAHLRYGAELVASLGRSIRDGYMAACTDHVAELTGRPARSLREVLEPLRAARGQRNVTEPAPPASSSTSSPRDVKV
jgi:NAD(P)H dehydrogenase (quinone)